MHINIQWALQSMCGVWDGAILMAPLFMSVAYILGRQSFWSLVDVNLLTCFPQMYPFEGCRDQERLSRKSPTDRNVQNDPITASRVQFNSGATDPDSYSHSYSPRSDLKHQRPRPKVCPMDINYSMAYIHHGIYSRMFNCFNQIEPIQLNNDQKGFLRDIASLHFIYF